VKRPRAKATEVGLCSQDYDGGVGGWRDRAGRGEQPGLGECRGIILANKANKDYIREGQGDHRGLRGEAGGGGERG